MRNALLLGIGLLITGCHATISTPSGLREWGKAMVGMQEMSKAKPMEPVNKGYWTNQNQESQGRWFSYTDGGEK